MLSNSKLTKYQKAERKQMLADLPNGSTFANSACGTTVLCVPDGPTIVSISTAVMSPDEKKFRRKVGEYYALVRYFADAVTVLPRDVIPNASMFILAVFEEDCEDRYQ